MSEEIETDIQQILSGLLFRKIKGIVIAFIDEEETVSFRYHGKRVLCRGLTEELRDYMIEQYTEAEGEYVGEEETEE